MADFKAVTASHHPPAGEPHEPIHRQLCGAATAGAAPFRPRRGRLRNPVADPGRLHPPSARGPRPARRGADRHRQDGRLRAAAAGLSRHRRQDAPGPGADADARTGDPGGRGLPEIRPPSAGLPRAADLRRPEHGDPVARAVARGACHRRHAGARHGPPRKEKPETRRPAHAGARRGRRDAAHGLHRRRRVDSRAHAGDAPDRAVLGDHARPDPPHRPALPARAAAGEDSFCHDHGRDDQAEILAGARRRQTRGADAHARGRGRLRRRNRLRAHQDRDRRTGRQARGAWLRSGGAQRRHDAGPARAGDRAPQVRLA